MVTYFPRESFWLFFSGSAVKGVVTDFDMPVKLRNLQVDGWWACQTNANREVIVQLIIKEYSRKEKQICPIVFNDTLGTATSNTALRPPLETVVYDPSEHKEFPLSPFRWCDVEYITVRAENLNVANDFALYGHVRGVYLG